MGYTDDTLIRLRRIYSKDETIAYLSKKLSESEIKNGKLQSQLDEETYKVNNPKAKRLKHLENENKILIKKNSDLKVENRKILSNPKSKIPRHIQIEIKELKKENQILREKKNSLVRDLKKFSTS